MPNTNTISCGYCGEKFPIADNVGLPNKVMVTPELHAHIRLCKLHPLAKALEQIGKLEVELAELRKEHEDGKREKS